MGSQDNGGKTEEKKLDQIVLYEFLLKDIRLSIRDIEVNHGRIFQRLSSDPARARLMLIDIIKRVCDSLIKMAEVEDALNAIPRNK